MTSQLTDAHVQTLVTRLKRLQKPKVGGHSSHARRRRLRLWTEDARCYWCRRITLLEVERRREGRGAPQANAATVDHLYARGDSRRRTIAAHVLACHGCNNDRSNHSPEQWRLHIANRYYNACKPESEPSDRDNAIRYLKKFGLYEDTMTFTLDDMTRLIMQQTGVPRDRAEATARQQLGLPVVTAPTPTTTRQPIRFPITLMLPWSALCSDNKKCHAHGDRHMLTPEYLQSRAAIIERTKFQLGDVEPVTHPLALVARVCVPDNHVHDVPNFAKGVHDALQGIVYKSDAQLWDTRWIRAGVDVDRPRAELTFTSLHA